MPPGISLDCHELSHIGSLIDRPILVKLLQKTFDFGSVTKQLLRSELAEILRHSCLGCHHREMQLRDGVLKLTECLIHHVALLEYHLGELILLSIDPEVGEGLLS